MTIDLQKRLIDVAMKRRVADYVITNANVVDVYNGKIMQKDVAIVDSYIAAIGDHYEGKHTYDAKGNYLIPGLIDAHVHIESSLVDPVSFGHLLLARGTTTAVCDPHEICNVAGIEALDFMVESSQKSQLSFFFMVPSCVPSTSFEHSGATIDAKSIASRITQSHVLGLGEMMDMQGVIEAQPSILEKLHVAHSEGKVIDGHGPSLTKEHLQAFITSGIMTDHECTTPQEVTERIESGMYVLLREGSASSDLRALLPAVTSFNSRRCMFCTDDRQVKSIIEEGHIDNHLRIAVQEGIDPIEAIRMASLNAAEAYRLSDRGAIAPAKRADLVLVNNLTDFSVEDVFVGGVLYKKPTTHTPMSIPTHIEGKIYIGPIDEEDFALHLSSNNVRVIGLEGSSLVTTHLTTHVTRDDHNRWVYQKDEDIVKLAVIERHHATGNKALALLQGYGLKDGAIALTIAHDSHNVIIAGTSDKEMFIALEALKKIHGGIVMVHNNTVIETLSLPIAGLMTNEGSDHVLQKLEVMYEKAFSLLQVSHKVDPFMTLSFMALPVIPSLKVTDMGLFDVDSYSFVPIEVDEK
ncbi:MAG: adenine deaminase [Sphaerochaetaceae bacterium]